MRIRQLAVAGAMVAALAAVAGAQGARDFEDSWFWGLKTGVMTYGALDANTATAINGVAPIAGLDWLITRTQGGLYLSYSQAFLNKQVGLVNGPTAADTGLRAANVKGLSRFDIALMGFPGKYERVHPYVGIGASVNILGSVAAQGPFNTSSQSTFADSAIQASKAAVSLALVAGAQYRFPRMSAFGQISFGPPNKTFLLYNSGSQNFSLEFGIRYNIGSSIDDH